MHAYAASLRVNMHWQLLLWQSLCVSRQGLQRVQCWQQDRMYGKNAQGQLMHCKVALVGGGQ